MIGKGVLDHYHQSLEKWNHILTDDSSNKNALTEARRAMRILNQRLGAFYGENQNYELSAEKQRLALPWFRRQNENKSLFLIYLNIAEAFCKQKKSGPG